MTVKTYTASYTELVTLAANLTKVSIKPFGWEIASRANLSESYVFENGLDYDIGIKFVKVVKAYKQTNKRPKTLTFKFESGNVSILSASGKVIIS